MERGKRVLQKPMVRMSSLLHIVGPLLIGGLIYLGWRSPSLLMFGWLDHLGCTDAVTLFREQLHPFERNLPEWVLYSVPDAAWVWSMTSCFTLIWKQYSSKESIFWACILCKTNTLDTILFYSCEWFKICDLFVGFQ